MGNRDGPACTARMQVEIRQSWARQSSGWKARALIDAREGYQIASVARNTAGSGDDHMNDRLEYRRSLGLPKDPPVYRAYRCGMCGEEFYVEHVGDEKPNDTACVNCGSDETELDLPACLPASPYRK